MTPGEPNFFNIRFFFVFALIWNMDSLSPKDGSIQIFFVGHVVMALIRNMDSLSPKDGSPQFF